MNELNLLAFGKIADILNGDRLSVPVVNDADSLRRYLEQKYPGLGKLTYAIAINRKIADGNTKIESGSEVALLPPFSGG